ncbi:MotA/TolQ/ExbB proton channel family protein [Novosphingobium sp.]|uniref:MotA/TolQ/ExbB proton channel family protein n=1 Tax=Novosphingobium sp. TaxID=1874826 RepID=UPI0026315137|nr:MotA/TolQ/ExbB proton channel family protein [Novosphingobium sp.]
MNKGQLDLSPARIFLDADPLVQGVIAVLLLASVVSWSIIIGRAWSIARERRRLARLDALIGELGTPDDLAQACDGPASAAARLGTAIGAEWRWSAEHAVRGYAQLRARVLSVADLAIARESARVAGRTSFLATIGSIAPFVGLFGTVWGIMRSFISIGQSQDTSLAVVAPGIAEALMATAIGLFCAIPAVVGYNRLLHGLGQLETGWRALASRIEVEMSRRFEKVD